MSQDFKERLRQHFSSESLNDNQVQRLMNLKKKTKKKPLFKKYGKQILTFCMAMCFSIFIIYKFMAPSLDMRIAKEVYKNHLKNSKLSIKTKLLKDVSFHLNKLDFEIHGLKKLSDANLIGGRYCSIQGQLAAQLSYLYNKGKRITVYQVLSQYFDKSLIKVRDYKFENVRVEINHVNDKLIVIAYEL